VAALAAPAPTSATAVAAAATPGSAMREIDMVRMPFDVTPVTGKHPFYHKSV
jgi:homogentisate 1,2-dioxygenase